MTYSALNQKHEYQFYCFKDSELSFREEFAEKIISHVILLKNSVYLTIILRILITIALLMVNKSIWHQKVYIFL